MDYCTCERPSDLDNCGECHNCFKEITPLTHYPMNTCCEKCETAPVGACCGTCNDHNCPCHQEKPTHEIGWEKDALHHLHVVAGLFRDGVEERYELAQKEYLAFISSLLSHQKESMRAEHLKDISQHRGGAFKHGRSVGIKETKESIVASAKQHERFLDKVDKIPGGCWEWKASITTWGYGQFHYDGHTRGAHRYSYTYYKGLIPENLDIDHLCRNRACVNPTHLEAVTTQVNVLRGIGTAAKNAVKTHCKRGHELWGDNIRIIRSRGRHSRICKTCQNATKAAYRARKRAKRTALADAVEVVREV